MINKEKFSQERNNLIDIFRYLFAVNVVIFHCQGFSEINPLLNYVLAQIPTRIAVPFFFTVGGYFFCIKVLSEDNTLICEYFKKEWITYSIWSALYFAMVLFALRDEEFLWKDYIFQCLRNFFIFGSYYHLWYIPVMLFSATLFYFAYIGKKVNPLLIFAGMMYLIGCMGTSYYNFFVQFPTISELFMWEYFAQFTRFLCRGVPFFILGAEIYLQQERLVCFIEKTSVIMRWVGCVVVFLLFTIEHYVIFHYELMESPVQTLMLMPFVALLLLILLRYPAVNKRQLGRMCRGCSGFVYFSHPAIILVLQKGFEKFGIIQSISPTVLSVMTITLGTLGGMIVIGIKAKRKMNYNLVYTNET